MSPLADEQGIALIMALGIMLILTIALTTIAFLTTHGTQDAQRTNAGQRATALAEAGVNNAVAVLNKNYPAANPPGPSNLLPPTTTTYPGGTVTWSGSLVQSPQNSGWPYQWNITAVGDVKNPSGPGVSDIKRTLTAVVPITLPTTWQQNSGQSAINFIYAFHNITFSQSAVIEAPIYATGNLELDNTSWVSETVPASATNPAHPNLLAVGGTLLLSNQYNPNKGPNNNGNHIGEWIGDGSGTTYQHEQSSGQLAEVYVAGNCSSFNNSSWHSPCQEGDGVKPGSTRDSIYAQNQSAGNIPTTFPPPDVSNFFSQIPNMTCCYPISTGGSVTSNNTPPQSDPSPPADTYMGFWWTWADLGPRNQCDPTKSTGAYPTFDNNGTMDGNMPTWNLTGAAYDCVRGSHFIDWDPTTKKLTINGTIFYDGNVCVGSSGCGTNVNATYTGSGSIILTGSFSMVNGDNMCVPPALSGGGCDATVSWNPNNSSLGVIAYGNDGSGNSIAIKKGQIQALLMGYHDVYCEPASGTFVQGPLISVDADVICGNSNTLSFPAISFPSTGFAGSTGPLPPAVILPPVQYGGG